ncbi:MAG: hypothetical protein HYU88_13840 [Chloroflexi bacterium]|nr:hypothetical protein [Chloroflexota bacterium]
MATTITGTVERVNGRGFRLAEREGWLNLSKWAEVGTELPAAGQHVTLDKGGYMRRIEAAQSRTEPGSERSHYEAPDREQLMPRMSCLRAAGDVFTGTGRSAEALEGWALGA